MSAGKPYRPPARATFENVTRKRAVAIGISTGGPATLQEVLPQIPADVPASIFLVQHMPPAFIASFAKRLDDHCALKVVEGAFGHARGAERLLRGAGRDASVSAPQDDGRGGHPHAHHAGDAVRALGGRHDGVGSEYLRELTPSAS